MKNIILKKLLNVKKVDLATADTHNETLQKTIKNEFVYV